MFQNVIFDFDGTLIDSAEDIMLCLKEACVLHGIASADSITKTLIGPPVADMLKQLNPEINNDLLNKALITFRKLYDSCGYHHTKTYYGVKRLLQKLHKSGTNLFIVTNKPIKYSKAILTKLKIEKLFLDIISPDSENGAKLSKEEMISFLLDKWSLDKSGSIMVGDSKSDIMAAHENKIMTIAVLGGYGDKQTLLSANPTYVTHNTKDAYDIIQL